MTLKRAISVDQLLKMTFDEMEFENEWLDAFGIPERSGVWIIWGNSGNGKTDFTVKLCKYLANFGKVAYNTMEEGARKSFQIAVIRNNMRSVAKKLVFLNREPIDELKVRLSRKKSPDIIVIDSFQYTGLNKKEYIQLKEQFPKKLFIFISHAEGKNPEGRPAKFVRYDADVKIRIEGYKALPVSRYGGGKPIVIWEKGASEYWGDLT